MDPRSFNPQTNAFESTSCLEPYQDFKYYHPDMLEYADCLDERDPLADSVYPHLSMPPPLSFDLSDGFVPLSTLGSPEHDQYVPQHTSTIPAGKMSTYSELMPHVVAHCKTTPPLKQDVRVATKPQPCVSPALCQGHADLLECAEIDDELDCPGEPAGDDYVESSDEEEDDDHPPPSSPSLTPSPSPSPLYPSSSTSRCCEPPRTSRVIRSARTQNRYSPIEVKAPSRKGKSAIQRTASGSGDEESKKPKKRREAVSLACYFCRKRKIACRQPPEGNPDRTCNQCRARGMECEYPTESRRGARRGSAPSHKHGH